MNFFKRISKVVCFLLTFGSINAEISAPKHVFSKTACKFFTEEELAAVSGQKTPELMWESSQLMPFNELIVSWNAFRPEIGHMTLWVSVKYRNQWSRWHRLAQWGPKYQRTFLNKLHPVVHTKHCRVEMQKNTLARGFRMKMVFHNGANPTNLKSFFGCFSRLSHFKILHPNVTELPSVAVRGIPRQSQMVLNHGRFRDLCSPVSTSMLVGYFHQKLFGAKPHDSMHDFSVDFANKAHDQGYLNIYGNWILNVAEAFDRCKGSVFFRVERLNSFYDLHKHLSNKVPVAVSVRRLRGGATPYANGHIMVVVGWNKLKRKVLCIDPAFSPSKATLKAYRLSDFLHAWSRSNNLAYVPMLPLV